MGKTKVGIYDVDSVTWNLALMKISGYHKAKGDQVEFVNRFEHYDKVYVSKIFGDEYSKIDDTVINADEIVYGGSGFALRVVDGTEVFDKSKNTDLPYEVEHCYPDYDLYGEDTKNKAIGFLTRGCPNNCGFCIASQKEGVCSVRVSELKEWWNGQKEIYLMDPNILACKERESLIQELKNSKARINFFQGLDARFMTKDVAGMLKGIDASMWHFAFDEIKNSDKIIRGLKNFKEVVEPDKRKATVYILTNYGTTFEEDMWRIKTVEELGYTPFVMVYIRNSLPKHHILKDLQRWCNNRFIYRSTDFAYYKPRGEKTVKELWGI